MDTRGDDYDSRDRLLHGQTSPPNNPMNKDFYLQFWRSPRLRKLLILGCVVLFLSLAFFLKELGGPESIVDELASGPPPSHIVAAPVTITTTFTAPAVTETVYVYQDVATAPNVDPVVFVLIMWSEASAAEGALLIKSILLYNTSPSEFHIICDEAARKFLETRLALVTRPVHNVRVKFYEPSFQSMLDRVEREGSIRSDHSAGLPGLMKLFIHEIVPPSVKKGIYIDTDAIFVSDPTLLWNVFSSLKPKTAIVMSSHPDQDVPEWHHASRICSCIMLLDLEKLRDMRLMDSSIYRSDKSGDYPSALAPPAFRAMYGTPSKDTNFKYDNVRLGDQGYWWAIVDHRPDIFEPLSYDFEVTSCLLQSYNTGLGDEATTEKDEMARQIFVKGTPQEGHVILPKLLHFNCLHGTPIYMDWAGWADPQEALTQRWGPAVFYHAGFKWIWLNKGNKRNSDATLQVSTISNVVFGDEQFARDHAIHA